MRLLRVTALALVFLLVSSSSAFSYDPAEEKALKQTDKPNPAVKTFHGCSPHGQGGDPDLNYLKNRVDIPDSYLDISFGTLVSLKAPIPTQRKDRANWRDVDASFVKELE